jgi:hypothetical protein
MIRVRDATKNESDWIDYDTKAQQALNDYFNTEAKNFNTLYTAVFTIYTGLLVFFGLMNGQVLKLVSWPGVLVFLFPVLA